MKDCDNREKVFLTLREFVYTSIGRIHKNEGYPSKHKVEVKGNALKQKIEA